MHQKHLTKKQLRKILKHCSEFTINDFAYAVIFTSGFDTDLSIEVLRGMHTRTKMPVAFAADELLTASISECAPDTLRLGNDDLMSFYRTDKIKFQLTK